MQIGVKVHDGRDSNLQLANRVLSLQRDNVRDLRTTIVSDSLRHGRRAVTCNFGCSSSTDDGEDRAIGGCKGPTSMRHMLIQRVRWSTVAVTYSSLCLGDLEILSSQIKQPLHEQLDIQHGLDRLAQRRLLRPHRGSGFDLYLPERVRVRGHQLPSLWVSLVT